MFRGVFSGGKEFGSIICRESKKSEKSKGSKGAFLIKNEWGGDVTVLGTDKTGSTVHPEGKPLRNISIHLQNIPSEACAHMVQILASEFGMVAVNAGPGVKPHKEQQIINTLDEDKLNDSVNKDNLTMECYRKNLVTVSVVSR